MFQLPLTKLKRILCLGAHPDDIEIGCGGTLLSLMQTNPQLEMTWVIFSANKIRQAEAEASFSDWCHGLSQQNKLIFHHFPDSFFPWHGAEIKHHMHQLSAENRADLIFTPSRQDKHQDHRTIGELVGNAFRDHFILEYEIPKYDGDLGRPNVFFPLSREIAERKIEILMANFESQQTKNWYRPETFQAIMHLRAIESNSSTGFAEAFHGSKVVLARI